MTRRDIFKMFAGVPALPAVKAVEVLDVKKDDTIVLTFQGRATCYELERASHMMKEHFPEQKCLILDDRAKVEVLRAR